MDTGFRLHPEGASTLAPQVDALYFYLVSITAFFSLLIFVLIVYFAIKYRRTSDAPPPKTVTNYKLELLWSVIPFFIVMSIFFWGARVYFNTYAKPVDPLEIQVIGRQWMWKVQHPDGTREINELHVPTGRPVQLTMGSQDVIHSFFIPAFRIKQDVVPGRFTKINFVPTKPGTYHLFCAEYCGTQHSGMIGRVVVMEPEEYQNWLAGSGAGESPAQAGAKLYSQLGCITCHGSVAPTLAGLYMRQTPLANGKTITADDDYIRRSILDSTADVVAGYAPIMPSFRGQVTEEQLMQLVAYIKSLKNPEQQRVQP